MSRSNALWVFLLALCVATAYVSSCKKSPTETNGPALGKRDYLWSIDSVDYGNLPSVIQLGSIWGSSATDVWGAAGDAPDVRDCLWHYNGMRWDRATAGTPIVENTGNKTVYSVWGSSRNDVWSVGRRISQGILSAFIMHFDGTRWTDATPTNVSAIMGHLYTLYGISRDDIWAFGYEYALHFNGTQWTMYKVGDSLIVASISGNGRFIYATSYSPWGRNIQFVYRFVGSAFDLIDSTTYAERKFGLYLWAQESKLVSFLNGVVTANIRPDGGIETNSWSREFTTLTPFVYPFVQGSSNAFAVGQQNLIYHYNGGNWSPISIMVPGHTVSPDASFSGVWADGREVFVCDIDHGIVYHGR